MSGGQIQGDRPKQNNKTAEDIVEEARADNSALYRSNDKNTRINSPTGISGRSQNYEVTNYGPPSSENDRPMNAPGERDPAGIAPGRKNPMQDQERE